MQEPISVVLCNRLLSRSQLAMSLAFGNRSHGHSLNWLIRTKVYQMLASLLGLAGIAEVCRSETRMQPLQYLCNGSKEKRD